MLAKLLQLCEVCWESLAGATWIQDCDGHVSTSSEREGHGHTVVIICFDFCRGDPLRRSHYAVILALFYLRSKLPTQGTNVKVQVADF